MRYVVYCWEIGNDPNNPIFETDDKEEAIRKCKESSKKYRSRVFVRDFHIDKEFYCTDYNFKMAGT